MNAAGAGDPCPRAEARGQSRLRATRRGVLLALLGLLALAAAGTGLVVGPVPVTPAELWAWISGARGAAPLTAAVLGEIRLPRVVMGFAVGAALAVAGVVMQGLFRNPLADPGLIGVSAGAALGAVAVIVLGPGVPLPGGFAGLAGAAFVGGLLATLAIHALSVENGEPVVATMLLAGVAVNALAGALTAFLLFLADDAQARDVTFWLLGSLAAATWGKVAVVAPVVALGLLGLPWAGRRLNALVLGEAEAAHLGVHVRRVKVALVAGTAVGIGVAVAFTGVIGFVGLVVPHALRLMGGADHRFLLPAAALAGGALLVLADAAARTVVAPAELPIGVLTALLGAPFFLWLLRRYREGGRA